MLPKDNRLAQPPNEFWLPIASLPENEQVALTDTNKLFVWIGMATGKTAPGMGDVAAVYWSPIEKQFDVSGWPQHQPKGE